MPEIRIPTAVITGLQLLLAFGGAFFIALWISLIVWTFRDVRARSRDVFAILLATLMGVVVGPLGLLIYFLLRPPVTLAELYERSLEEEALLQDLEERPRCPGCSRQVDTAWIVCPDCHTALKKTCPHCGEGLNLNWDICPFCATAVETAPPPQESPPPPQGEPQPAYAPATRPTAPAAAPIPLPSSTEEQSSSRAGETRPQVPQTESA